MTSLLSIDAGTTGIRALVINEKGEVVDLAYRELNQSFTRPGWVEHDPNEIWAHVRDVVTEVGRRLSARGGSFEAAGITNQRETVVAWDRRSGQPLHPAIVWQDRRTADRCDELIEAGRLPLVRSLTGLVIDPYFSATKMAWLLENEDAVHIGGNLAMGTVDTWVLWNLTGGPNGGAFLTDASNASRTLLFDIERKKWSDELCEMFGVPMRCLAEVRPSCGRVGTICSEALGADCRWLDGVPISGLAGDQQAALFGQACFETGMAKATFGTGTFVLSNVGPVCPAPAEGLLTTIAWDLGEHGVEANGGGNGPTYALEGSALGSGAAVQWLRDGLGIIDRTEDLEALAESATDSSGLLMVPALTGLGGPWWDPRARGLILGITRGSGRAELARATVESLAFEVRSILNAMTEATGSVPRALRVDGGGSAMRLLLQLLADQVRITVSRPRSIESTAVGAAMLSGLAEGVWGSLDQLASLRKVDVELEPSQDSTQADAAHASWLRAVDRSRRWSPL